MKRIFLLLSVSAGLWAAPLQVLIDTTALNTQVGTIDIQFNPFQPSGANPGAAAILYFLIEGGSLGGIAAGPDGGASGGLPGPLTIVNSDFLNGVTYNATFGTAVSFVVDFTGSAFTGTGQSNLTSLYVGLNGAGSTIVAQADLMGGWVLDSSSSSSGVTFQPLTAAVPEPSTFALLMAGVVALRLRARRN